MRCEVVVDLIVLVPKLNVIFLTESPPSTEKVSKEVSTSAMPEPLDVPVVESLWWVPPVPVLVLANGF